MWHLPEAESQMMPTVLRSKIGKAVNARKIQLKELLIASQIS
jgi:hypothetical protein